MSQEKINIHQIDDIPCDIFIKDQMLESGNESFSTCMLVSTLSSDKPAFYFRIETL